MGLFRNERRDMEEALGGLLGNIGANYRFHEGVQATGAVKDRVIKVNNLAERMRRKGKAEELRALASAWYGKQPPPNTIFRGDSSGVANELERQERLWADVDRELPSIAGSGPKARAEEERREEIAKMKAAREFWRSVVSRLSE